IFEASIEDVLHHSAPGVRDRMAERIEKFRKDNPKFSPNAPNFWALAMRLPDRARYWYEISAEKFRDAMHGTKEQLLQFFDLVAATSPQADPMQNLRRAIGVLAEERQGLAVKTDLTDHSAVRKALRGTGQNLTGLKTGSFANTFAH